MFCTFIYSITASVQMSTYKTYKSFESCTPSTGQQTRRWSHLFDAVSNVQQTLPKIGRCHVKMQQRQPVFG